MNSNKQINSVITGKKAAFSFAEILLVITIVGIISSYSIPALLQNLQERQLRVAWKSTYSSLDQATRRIMIDNAGSLKGVFTSFIVLRDKYLQYLLYTKSCSSSDMLGNCWHNNDGSCVTMAGATVTWGTAPSAILPSGSFITFSLNDLNCNNPAGTIRRCATLILDINGFKSPNTRGRDIFEIHVTETGIKPMGVQGDGFETTCRSNSSGRGCGALYLMQ